MPAVSPPESVFLDTCILLNYVNRYWEGDKVSALLCDDAIEHVISESVADEFETVCERREEIYPDMIAFVLEEAEEITAFDPTERDIWIAENDLGHVREIQYELADIADDNREVLRLLRRFRRNLEDVIETIKEDLIDTTVAPGGPISLSFRVADVVDNEADVKVICDAAQWAADGGPGVFVTLDSSDIIDNEAAINDVLETEQSGVWTLIISDPRQVTLPDQPASGD